ncbi:MAG: DPP IV N-terminal domain-containing protein, partial [Tidjanibacter sp.]|nr:DPP IV N-terminal domain-containing protein [Tidjanibacter sp.]
MKRYLFIIMMALASLTTTEAQERKLLTMEDAILSRQLTPQWCYTGWGTDAKGKTIYATGTSRENIEWFYPKNAKAATPAPQQAAKALPRYFTEGNNLYYELEGTKVAITAESNPDIISGSEVSRNEFGISEGIFPSPDGLSVAFYQKDVSRVADFPLLDITTRTGSLVNIKYPQNGLPSEHVSLGIYNTANGQTVWCKVTDFDQERYLTNITWSPDGKLVYIQVLNRAQKEVHLNSYCAATGEFVEQVCIDTDSRWVEPSYPLYFLGENPNRFLYSTNVRDGFWNLYLYERPAEGEAWSCRRLVDVDADIFYLGHDAKSVYYNSFEFSPVEQHLCKVDVKSGKTMRLTHAEGWHNCTLSPDGKWFFDNYSALKVPRVVNLGSTDGKITRTLFEAPDPTAEYNYTPIE